MDSEHKPNIFDTLAAHEAKSQWRYESLMDYIKSTESRTGGAAKMEGINSDKVNINLGEGGGGSGGLNAMAAIAALGQRNESSTLVPLLAALGHRNEERRDDGFGFGGGGGILGLVALLGLLRGRGGLGGDDCNSDGAVERPVFNAAVLSKLGSIEGEISNAALATQNEVCNHISQLGLATQQGFASVKDATQALALFLGNQLNNINQNVSDQGCRTRDVVQATSTAILTRIDGNRIAELEAQVARMHSHDHTRDSEIRITQNVNQQQLQTQQQAQLQGLFNQFANLANDLQLIKQGQTIFNTGTMAASGTQAAANTKVN